MNTNNPILSVHLSHVNDLIGAWCWMSTAIGLFLVAGIRAWWWQTDKWGEDQDDDHVIIVKSFCYLI
jgi:hypothetical protein